MLELKFYCQSVKGKRSNNQDSIIGEKIGENTYFFAVADGMGGANGGEVASQTIIDVAIRKVTEESKKRSFPKKKYKVLLKEIVKSGHKELLKMTKESPDLTGMGTTLVAMIFHKNKYVWSCIGDSRIYKLKGKELVQITKDDSFLQDYLDEHSENPPEEIVKKFGHIISKTIDGNSDEPTIYPIDKEVEILNENDAFLLCSDGLILDKVNTSDSLAERFFQSNDLRVTGDRLINYAMNNGSTDNVSVILIDTNENRSVSETPKVKSENDDLLIQVT